MLSVLFSRKSTTSRLLSRNLSLCRINLYDVIWFWESFISLGECVINYKCYLIQRILSPRKVFLLWFCVRAKKFISILHVSIVSKSLMKIFCQLKLFISLLRERGDIWCRSSISFFILHITYSKAIGEDIYTSCVSKQLWWLWHIQGVPKNALSELPFCRVHFFGTPCTGCPKIKY